MPSGSKQLIGMASYILLSACGSDAGVGGVTASEAAALNDAAAIIDAQSNVALSPAVGLNPAAVLARDRNAQRPAVNSVQIPESQK